MICSTLLHPTAYSAELQFDLISISESRALNKDPHGKWKIATPGKSPTLPQILGTVLSVGLFYDKEAGKDRQILRLLFKTDGLPPVDGWKKYTSNIKLNTAKDDQGNSLKVISSSLHRTQQSEAGILNIALHATKRASTRIALSGDVELTEISLAESLTLSLPVGEIVFEDSSLKRHAINIHYQPHRSGSFKFPEYPVLRFQVRGNIDSFRSLKITNATGKRLMRGEAQFHRTSDNELLVSVDLWKPLPENSLVMFELGKPEYRTTDGTFTELDIPLP